MFRRMLRRNEPLTDEQMITVNLAVEFLTVTVAATSNKLKVKIMCDNKLIEDIKTRYQIGDETPQEPCGICRANILFY